MYCWFIQSSFSGIEHGVAAADVLERERGNQLVARHQLAIAAGRPAKQGEEIDHRLRHVPHRLVFGHRGRAMPLAQALLVRPEDERNVGERRDRLSERLIQENLLRRVRDVIVAANHVRDAHVDVVGHDREVIRRLTIRPQHHEILDVGVVEANRPVHQIVERRLALGNEETNGARRAGRFELRDVVRTQIAARAVVHPAAAGSLRGLTLGLHGLGRAVAEVGAAFGDEAVGHRAVPVEALRLVVGLVRTADVRPFIPVHPQPAQAVDDALRPSPTTTARHPCLRCGARTCRRDGARTAS